jgi:hypothetical protein
MRYDIREIKAGDTVYIKDTKIKALVLSTELVAGKWICTLEGWPGKVMMDSIEVISQQN